MLPLLYCRRRRRGRLCCFGARMTERWKHSGARVPAKEPRFDSARRSSADRVSYLIPRGFSPRQVHQFFLFFKGNTSKLIVDLNARRQVERRLWVMNFCIVKGLLGPYSAFWQVHCEKINDTLTPSFLRTHYGTSKQRNQMLFLISTPQSRTYQ